MLVAPSKASLALQTSLEALAASFAAALTQAVLSSTFEQIREIGPVAVNLPASTLPIATLTRAAQSAPAPAAPAKAVKKPAVKARAIAKPAAPAAKPAPKATANVAKKPAAKATAIAKPATKALSAAEKAKAAANLSRGEALAALVRHLQQNPNGCRAEELRSALGLDRFAFIQATKDGLATEEIRKTGRLRGTMYFAA
jgi:hypothetical protein